MVIGGRRVKINGVEITNHLDDGEVKFNPGKRLPESKKPVKYIVLHETAGNEAENTKRTLARRGKKHGIHLIVNHNGVVSCHGDLWDDVFWHGNQLNLESIGIEFVNPYNPLMISGKHLENGIFDKAIPAPWWCWVPRNNDVAIKIQLEKRGLEEVPKFYVLPTYEQLEVLMKLIPVLCRELNVPMDFPTFDLSRKKPRIKRWKQRAKPAPGIVAHRDFASHADGRYLLEYFMETYNPDEHCLTWDYENPYDIEKYGLTYDVAPRYKEKENENKTEG